MSILKLEISKSKILNDLIIFHPSINFDIRGNIFTSYCDSLYKKHIFLLAYILNMISFRVRKKKCTSWFTW